jgi:hypothetical protein
MAEKKNAQVRWVSDSVTQICRFDVLMFLPHLNLRATKNQTQTPVDNMIKSCEA